MGLVFSFSFADVRCLGINFSWFRVCVCLCLFGLGCWIAHWVLVGVHYLITFSFVI